VKIDGQWVEAVPAPKAMAVRWSRPPAPLLTLAGLNWLTQSSRSRLCLVKSAGTGKRDSAGRVM